MKKESVTTGSDARANSVIVGLDQRDTHPVGVPDTQIRRTPRRRTRCRPHIAPSGVHGGEPTLQPLRIEQPGWSNRGVAGIANKVVTLPGHCTVSLDRSVREFRVGGVPSGREVL